MSILGFSFNGSEVYLAFFSHEEEWQINAEKFTLSDDGGQSLRELYNYVELYLDRIGKVDMFVLETTSSGPHMPSLARVKAEGVIDMAINDRGLGRILHKIKTQKRKKHYARLPENPDWQRFRSIKYFAKIDQIAAYLILEGHV